MSLAIAAPHLRNSLLMNVPRQDWMAILPRLENVELKIGQTIGRPNKPIEHIYFPENGLVSILKGHNLSAQLEVGLIGYEGMAGISYLLGQKRWNLTYLIQISGIAQRMTIENFDNALKESPTFKSQLLQYVARFMQQLTQTAYANGRANISARLARWLLMTQDRIDGNEVPLTHDFMALMLGVRRSSVTVALRSMQDLGFIRSERALVIILDRESLISLAGEFYMDRI